MRPFNLKEYIKNPNIPILTRAGRHVRIICTDMKNGDNTFKDRSVVALIEEYCDRELIVCVKPNGRYSEINDCEFDLFFAPEKKEGWVNIYKDNINRAVGAVYTNKEEAEKNRTACHVATIKITWEE